ncbi:hypothetical protein BDFB_000473 [Asbolus verrucosus]|uniref:Nudix hydrolase domain-containing protein n=1 Tax=Asbolus verrucosus TaxID=1661398 RepID=A0A482VVW9_ASBVE|nr:hypothetical protein BDFB_000473 [Asbolus verrucosus]
MRPNLKIWRESASLILAAKSVFTQSSLFNYKILCLKRSSKSQFMPEMYVFPGGNVEKNDSSSQWLKLYEKFGFGKESFDELKPTENMPKILQDDGENELPKYLSFRISAIRETFEECGVLLCKSPKINHDVNSKWASFVGGLELIKWQHKVHDDSLEFLNLCSHFQIYPDVWALKNWSNWLTPPPLPSLKFNTIFFLATLPQMPTVNSDEKEIQDLMWTTPDHYLSLSDEQTVLLPLPQFYEISRLRTVTDIDTLSNFANERSKHGFEPYWPFRVKTDDGLIYSILPGDDLYPAEINKDNTETLRLAKLPECNTKNRILHTSKYSNAIQVQNFTPNCNHLTPYRNCTL